MKKSTVIVMVALVLILVLAASAFAQAPVRDKRQAKDKAASQGLASGWQGPNPNEVRPAFASLQRLLMPPSPRELEKIGMAMNLTDDQKVKIKGLYQTFGGVMRQLLPQRAAGVKATLQALQQPNPSKANMEAAATKVQDLDRAVLSAEIDFWIGLKGILNAQQQQQVQNYLMQRAEREMNGGPKPGPGAPPQQPNQQAPPPPAPAPSQW